MSRDLFSAHQDVVHERLVRAVHQCREQGSTEVSLAEFAELTGMPESSLAFPLKVLIANCLLEERAGGTFAIIV